MLQQEDLRLSNPGMPDNTGSSKGIDTNRAFEKLFSGIGDAINVYTKGKTQDVTREIRLDANKDFEDLNTEAGIEPPSGFNDGVDQIRRMQDAFEQGKISDIHYYGRMTNQLKSLRAKYPGFENIVDNVVQDVTGTRPANSYRNALMSAIDKEQAASEAAGNKWDTYVKQNEEYIIGVAPDYFQDPDKYDQTTIRQKVAERKAQDQNFQSDNLRLENELKMGEVTEERAGELINNRMNSEVSMALGSVNTSLGLEKFISGKANSTNLGAEEFGQLTSNFKAIKLSTELRLRKIAASQLSEDSNDTYYTVGGGTEKVNKIIEAAMEPFNQIEEYLGAKDWNMAAYHSKLIEYRSNRDLNTILGSSETLRTGSAISKISPQLGETFFSQNASGREAIENLSPEILSGVVIGEDTLGDAATRYVGSKAPTQDKTSGVNSLIDGTLRGITSGQGSPQERVNLIRGAYDSKSQKALYGLVRPAEYGSLFSKMYNPEVTAAIQATGDKGLIELYAKSALDRVTAIPEIRTLAADFQDNVEYAKMVNVGYDEKSNRLMVTLDPSKAGAPKGFLASWQNDKMIQKLVEGKDALNSAFASLSPIVEMAGGDETEAVKVLLNNLAIDLGADKKNTFIKTITDALNAQNTGSATRKFDGEGKEIGDLTTRPFAEQFGKGVVDLLNPPDDGKSFKEKMRIEAPIGKYKPIKDQFSASDAVSGNTPEAMNFVGKLNTSNKRGYNPDVEHLRPNLAQGIVDLQSAWGESLPIVSGYRSPGRNAKAGGAKHSQHKRGNAVDIDVSNLSIAKRKKLIALASSQGFGGIGVYENSLHLDKGRRRAWGPSHSRGSVPAWAEDIISQHAQ